MEEKHCEWCGELTHNYFYRFIIQPDYIIFLKSPLINFIDRQNQIVELNNGKIVDYSAIESPEIAASYSEIFPHIFCSENCEDSYVSTHTFIYRNDLEYEIAVLSFAENNIFSPRVIPIERIKHSNAICHHCNNEFPNYNKRFSCVKIRSKKIKKANFGEKPDLQHYPIVFSDMHSEKPEGNYFLFDIEMNKSSWEEKLFCSNECAFDYSQKQDKIILYKNNMLRGNFSIISPYTLKINEGLNNPYKYRPQKFVRT